MTRLPVALIFIAVVPFGGCSDFKTAAAQPDARADAAASVEAGPRTSDARPEAATDAHHVGDSHAGHEGGGEAGHDASPHGVCTDAVCTVTTMVTPLIEPVAVAVDDKFIYWIEMGAVFDDSFGEVARSLKTQACTEPSCFGVLDSTILGGEDVLATTMALGPTAICYTQSFDTPPAHQVTCTRFSDGTQQALEQSNGYAETIWVGSSGAFWAIAGSSAAAHDGAVHGATFADASTTLASSRPEPWGLTSDGAHVYWSEVGADAGNDASTGAAYRSVGDGGLSPLATSQNAPGAVANYSGELYWCTGDGAVRRTRTDGTGPVEVVATAQPSPIAIAVDSSGIYWANAGTPPDYIDGSVAIAAAPEGAVTVMLTNIPNIEGIAIDTSYVYAVSAGTFAANYADGKIVRIAKTR